MIWKEPLLFMSISLNKKISDKEICFPLTKIGKNWVAEFVDSEGNHIEVYTSVKE